MSKHGIVCIFISALLLLTGSAYSLSPSNKMFYLMGEGGVFQGTFNIKDIDRSDTIPQSYAGTIQQNGYTGALGIGISKIFLRSYYLGLEFSGGGMNQNATFQSGAPSSSFTDKFAMEGYCDLTFVPGLFLTPSVAAYTKVGTTWGAFSETINTPTGFDATIKNKSSTRSAFGFTASLGVKKWVTPTLAVLAEYNFRDYGTVTFPSFENFTAEYSHRARIFGQSVQVGVTYQLA